MADRTVTDTTLLGDWADQYNLLAGDIGDIDTVTTTATDVVGAVNELDGEIGTLASLTTTANGNLVVAINEVDADLADKAPLASPALTGTPTAPTAAASTNTTQIATTAFVQGELTGLSFAASAVTSGTFADARIAESNVTQHEAALTITESQISDLGSYATLASPALTGNPTAPTQAGGNNTTRIATTAFVQGEIADFATLASPALTGTPTAPTATTGTSTTQIATTAFVQASVAAAGGGDVLKIGTPVDNQIAVWTGDGTVEGDSDLTWDTSTNTLSVSGFEVWNAGNDGESSGLDADLLDGQHGSHYLDFTNLTNLPDPTITLGGDLTGSVTLTDLASGTLTATIVDDSHNHVIGNVDGLQSALDDKADLASPALTGTPTAPTQTTGNDTTRIATTAFVQQELDAQTHTTADITSGTFADSFIPSLDAAKITTGSFGTARIPNLAASKITSGTFTAARIPSLAASKITSGEFDTTRIPDLDAAKITSGTFDAARIPDLGYFESTGGTLTGDLTVATISPSIILDETDEGTSSDQHRIHASAGVLFIESEGDHIIAGYNNTDVSNVYIRSGAANNTVWHAGNDGAGSGLDADVLDGQQGSYYLNFNNFSNLPDPVITLGGDLSGSVTLTNLGSGTLTATIGSNAVALGSNTTGNYVATITGTANEIEVSGSGSETAGVTIGLPTDVDVSGDFTADTITGRATGATRTTLTAADANTVVFADSDLTVPASTFTGRDIVIISTGNTSRTITRGSGLSMFFEGTNTASVTLPANSTMSVLFRTATDCHIFGNLS